MSSSHLDSVEELATTVETEPLQYFDKGETE